MKKLFIDVGSSTVKINEVSDTGAINLLATRSISFKKNFDPSSGISEENKEELFELMNSIVEKNPGSKIIVIATALFRKLDRDAKVKFIDEFFARTGLYFNVISQELENFYLETALLDKCKLNEPILLINIGGGSTELVVMYGKDALERHNIVLGVGTILTEFPNINDEKSGAPVEKVVNFVEAVLPVLHNKVRVAFYNGGELTYMKLAGYPIKKNDLFKDSDHPYLIGAGDFFEKNKEVFNKITLSELESMMPDDPKWMHGARSCSAIAEAICRKYSIEKIIPSDSNTVHGAVRQEFRKVTLSGSFRKHLDYILSVRRDLQKQGIQVLSPRFVSPKNPGDEFVVFDGEDGQTPLQLERHHLDSIENSDALIVCNPEGYVGASAMIEVGYAHSIGKRTIFVEKPEEFMLNTLPAEIGL